MKVKALLIAAGVGLGMLSSTAFAKGPEVVSGPGYEEACFKPWNAETKFFKWPAKPGPYKIALVNGFVANVWRIQMIQTAKAYAALPEVAKELKEFKVVSVGTDMAAQLGAVEDFINQGFDAVLIDPNTPTGWDRVIRLANQKGTVLVGFDNGIESKDIPAVAQDQIDLGKISGEWIVKNVGNKGKLLEVRGVAGTSVDNERHQGFRQVVEAPGNSFEVVEVVGNWAPGDSQKATADAIAAHGKFDGIFTQGGSNGTVQAFLDAGQPLVPMAGEGENLFRVQMAELQDKGLKGLSYGQSPAQVAIAMKAAIAALQGHPIPQLTSVPNPVVDYTTQKAGEDYFPELKGDFFAANAFPPCDIKFTAPQIMSQSGDNTK
ncbi:ribose transport system substrate-binding protein [Kaistia hirudinis]|uniref:Ribose transport system substrate-binding protein n=1 Tax=Kaistia hirudinis TaxID=1293440 RepID=A0A840AKU7_9HYPH|nr:substrate-binding domain-containing protein [Kaistia hirudinis]MBB3929667.1 ribose transport system substrate-binding protein [Kaistia hirudinis]